jgi:hypothetical protein
MAKRLFRIDTGINGGELVIGTVTEDFVKYIQELMEDEGEAECMEALENAEHDESYYEGPVICEDFCSWSEVDDLEHLYGVYADTEWSWVELPAGTKPGTRDAMENEYEGEVFEPLHLHDREAYHEEDDSAKDEYDVVPCMLYHTGEKGGMGCWFVETDGEDFDPSKFCYSTVATNVAEIVDQAWYDKEEIECDQSWCDTRSKGDWMRVGYFNKDWHDTREKRMSDEYCWDLYDEIQEENRQEEIKTSILTK